MHGKQSSAMATVDLMNYVPPALSLPGNGGRSCFMLCQLAAKLLPVMSKSYD